MGKKKGKTGSKQASAVESSSPSAQSLEIENSPVRAVEASGPSSPEASTQDSAPCTDAQVDVAKESPVKFSCNSSLQADDLRRELDACKQQIAELQAKVASLAEENQRLKSFQSVTSTSQTSMATTVPDFEALAQRIAALKAEQAEADAAREAAWSQLKSVVADIARLAAPDAVTKAGTPTSSTTVGFGAA